MIMKVYLAPQTLSSSLADAIEFCWKVLGLPDFEGCEATVLFIRNVDCIFDFLNAPNPWGKGYKSQLRKTNESIWRPRLLNAIKYLSQLKLLDNRPIYSCPRKTGFVGFDTAVLSVIGIFDDLVKPDNNKLTMLLSYKLSQDHLELLFAAVRARSGWCPNPAAAQFISAFKRLLIRHDVSVGSGNTQLMDQTKILNVSSGRTKKAARVERYDPKIYNAVENDRVQEKYGLNGRSSVPTGNCADDLEEFLNFAWASSNTLTEFSGNAVGYIAGFVVRKLPSSIKCEECIQGCERLSVIQCNKAASDSNCDIGLILLKCRGGLITPSDSVIEICKTAEKLFRKACNCNLGKPPKERNFPNIGIG